MKQTEEDFKKAIGHNIRVIRSAKQFSQEYMGQALGISNPAYSKMEAGVTDISISRILVIAQTLGVTLYELIDHELLPKTSDEIEEIRVKFNKAQETIIELQQRLLLKERNDKLNMP